MVYRSPYQVAILLLPSLLQCNTSHAFTSSSIKSRAVLPTSPSSSLLRAEVENLVEVFDKVDCKAYTPSKPSTSSSSDDEEDIIENGTAKRVQQNPLGKFADAASAAVFAGLHYNDQLGIKDSSKNLRVLWSRAYLNHVGAMKDDIAYQLLPTNTRDVIKALPKSGPLVNFQEFITSRTKFIDDAVDSFLKGVRDDASSEETNQKPQIVLFGAGYDTRSLRYNHDATFYEVDLPDVVDGKGRLQQYWKDLQAKAENGEDVTLPTRIGYDLNDAADSSKPSLSRTLTQAGDDPAGTADTGTTEATVRD